MLVAHPRPGTLRITKSRTRAALRLASMVLFFVAWYSFCFAGLSEGSSGVPALLRLLFWLFPLFWFPEISRQARVLTSGETFVLTRDTGSIQRNGTRIARFGDVARIQIRTFRDSEGGGELYRLSIVLRNDEKLRIHQSAAAAEIADAAEELADILGVEVTRKG